MSQQQSNPQWANQGVAGDRRGNIAGNFGGQVSQQQSNPQWVNQGVAGDRRGNTASNYGGQVNQQQGNAQWANQGVAGDRRGNTAGNFGGQVSQQQSNPQWANQGVAGDRRGNTAGNFGGQVSQQQGNPQLANQGVAGDRRGNTCGDQMKRQKSNPSQGKINSNSAGDNGSQAGHRLQQGTQMLTRKSIGNASAGQHVDQRQHQSQQGARSLAKDRGNNGHHANQRLHGQQNHPKSSLAPGRAQSVGSSEQYNGQGVQQSSGDDESGGIFQGLKNFFMGSKDNKATSHHGVKEHDVQSYRDPVNEQQPQCNECEKKDKEIKRMRDQTHLFMMEIELHLDGRSPSSLSLEWDDFFNGTAHQLAAAINSDTVPCKLFQACYDFVHKTVIELCGTYMKCLFTVYGDGSTPEDMRDIKNEKCRCYLKLVTTFGMNKKCPLTDLKQIRPCLEIEHILQESADLSPGPMLDDYLQKSLQLSWKLATCVPPMIASCEGTKYDRKKHSGCSRSEHNSEKYTLEYHSPVLYTNYTGIVKERGEVEIKSDSDVRTKQTSQRHEDKPSLEEIKREVQDVFNNVPALWNFAEALGMPENKIELVFKVKGNTEEDYLDSIIKWWLNRRRAVLTWKKVVEAIEKIPQMTPLANKIQKMYIK